MKFAKESLKFGLWKFSLSLVSLEALSKQLGATPAAISAVRSFLSGPRMTALYKPRLIYGGIPRGSVLGNMLFTLTTNELTIEVDYGLPKLNTAVRSSQEGHHTPSPDAEHRDLQIDMDLARIVTDQESLFGLNNITSEREEEDACLRIFWIEWLCDWWLASLRAIYSNTQRGQFETVQPPENLINSCLSDTNDA